MKKKLAEINSLENPAQLLEKRARKTSSSNLQETVTVNAVDSTSEENEELFLEGSVETVNTCNYQHNEDAQMVNQPKEDVTLDGDGGVVETDLSPNSDCSFVKTILENGEGSTPNDGTPVDVHLIGRYDGKIFEDRNIIFSLGKGSQHGICLGVEKALRHFKYKEKSVLQIKSVHVFGTEGNTNLQIPPDADVEFIVSLDNFMEKPVKCLPATNESFEDMIREKHTYVDKTEYLGKLIASKSKLHTLFRPRRFGKSVFLNMFESYFSGEDDLFEGLLIKKQNANWKCEKYPVIRIDFCNCLCRTNEHLINYLNSELSFIAENNGIELTAESVEGRFTKLINRMAKFENNQHGKVVILVDECDNPMRNYGNNCGNEDAQKENEVQHRNIIRTMKAFYSTIKKMARYVKFCLLVGVTNLSTREVFSGFNNIDPLDELEDSFDAVVGFTENEIKENFDAHLRELALKLKWKPAQIYDFIRKRYHGFRFTDSTITVYNPCSLLLYIESNGRRKSFFSQSGGSRYFKEQIIKKGNFAHTLFKRAVLNCLQNDASKLYIEVAAGVLYGADPVDLDSEDGWAAMFFQIGLLTIHDVQGTSYRLKFSNLEYQQFYLGVLSETASEKCLKLDGLADDIKYSMLNGVWTDFTDLVNSFLAHFPYSIINVESSTESVFDLLMYILLDKMKCDHIDMQNVNIAGSADLVATIENLKLTFIWGLKIENNWKDALHQSETYSRKFLNQNKDVICMGIQFSRCTREIVKFGVAKYNEKGTPYFRQPYEYLPKKVTLQLKETSEIDDDTKLLKFQCSESAKKINLGLPIGNYLHAVVEINDEFMCQAYTPITSEFSKTGYVVELVTKDYRNHPDSRNCDQVRQYIEKMVPGQEIEFRGPFGSLEYFNGTFVFDKPLGEVHARKLNMIAGDTGIISMLRIIRHIVTNTKDNTDIKLLFANRTPKGILFREELDKYRNLHKKKFEVCYTVYEPTEDWKDKTGFVSSDMIREHLHCPAEDTMVLMSGPPKMIASCSSSLDELGYEPKRRFNL